MPIKLSTRSLTESAEARIEIVPLIDIMFFLLASFMLVSLSMVHALTLKVNLPVAGTARSDDMKNVVTVAVDKSGLTYFNRKRVTDLELRQQLAASRERNPAVRVVIDGDRDARNGDVIRVLDLIRGAGIDKVGFDVRPPAERVGR